jgi:hypothetical protein
MLACGRHADRSCRRFGARGCSVRPCLIKPICQRSFQFAVSMGPDEQSMETESAAKAAFLNASS